MGSKISPQRVHLHPQKGSPGPKNFSRDIIPLQRGHFIGNLQRHFSQVEGENGFEIFSPGHPRNLKK